MPSPGKKNKNLLKGKVFISRAEQKRMRTVF
jgi:hypothetical protein